MLNYKKAFTEHQNLSQEFACLHFIKDLAYIDLDEIEGGLLRGIKNPRDLLLQKLLANMTVTDDYVMREFPDVYYLYIEAKDVFQDIIQNESLDEASVRMIYPEYYFAYLLYQKKKDLQGCVSKIDSIRTKISYIKRSLVGMSLYSQINKDTVECLVKMFQKEVIMLDGEYDERTSIEIRLLTEEIQKLKENVREGIQTLLKKVFGNTCDQEHILYEQFPLEYTVLYDGSQKC